MITIIDIVNTLNRANAADPQWMRQLLMFQAPCNQALADDPTIPVDMEPEGRWFTASVLGLINGFLPSNSDQMICTKWSEPDPKTNIRTFLGFGFVPREEVFSSISEDAIEKRAIEIYNSLNNNEPQIMEWIADVDNLLQQRARACARRELIGSVERVF